MSKDSATAYAGYHDVGQVLLWRDPSSTFAGSSRFSDEASVEYKTLDAVVMTQTCDIEQGKVESLLLCPRWGLWDFVEAARKRGQNWGKDQREALRRANLPGYHLLNEGSSNGASLGLSLVDFHEVYTAPTLPARIPCGTAVTLACGWCSGVAWLIMPRLDCSSGIVS